MERLLTPSSWIAAQSISPITPSSVWELLFCSKEVLEEHQSLSEHLSRSQQERQQSVPEHSSSASVRNSSEREHNAPARISPEHIWERKPQEHTPLSQRDNSFSSFCSRTVQ